MQTLLPLEKKKKKKKGATEEALNLLTTTFVCSFFFVCVCVPPNSIRRALLGCLYIQNRGGNYFFTFWDVHLLGTVGNGCTWGPIAGYFFYRFRSFFLFSARSDVYFFTPPFFPRGSTRSNADEFVRTQNRAESCRFSFTGRSPPTPESSSIPTVPVLLLLLLLSLLLLLLVLLLSAIIPLSVFVPYFRTCIIFLAGRFGLAQSG